MRKDGHLEKKLATDHDEYEYYNCVDEQDWINKSKDIANQIGSNIVSC